MVSYSFERIGKLLEERELYLRSWQEAISRPHSLLPEGEDADPFRSRRPPSEADRDEEARQLGHQSGTKPAKDSLPGCGYVGRRVPTAWEFPPETRTNCRTYFSMRTRSAPYGAGSCGSADPARGSKAGWAWKRCRFGPAETRTVVIKHTTNETFCLAVSLRRTGKGAIERHLRPTRYWRTLSLARQRAWRNDAHISRKAETFGVKQANPGVFGLAAKERVDASSCGYRRGEIK